MYIYSDLHIDFFFRTYMYIYYLVLLLLCYGSFPYRWVLFQTIMSVLFFVSGGVSTSRIWGVPQENCQNCPEFCVHGRKLWLVVELTGWWMHSLIDCCVFLLSEYMIKWVLIPVWSTAPGWYLPTEGRFCYTCCWWMLRNRLVGFYSRCQIR